MTVLEYLKLKYSNIKSTSLLSKEANIFNIPYPLKSGWLKIYGNTIITHKMSVSLREYFHYNSHHLHAIKVIAFLGGELKPSDQTTLDVIKKEDDYIKRVYGSLRVYEELMTLRTLRNS